MLMRITLREEDLVEEAAGVVRQAVTLARRRGHAQVTTLHLASAMLSPESSSSLRAACVSSQSHPLQHHALEICLDVALARLAAATHRGQPAASNAFCAALRRAQRLGAGDKVELEHLAVSVLDDPGVDRVMRDAGFSSSQLRACAAALSPQMQSGRAPGCSVVVTAASLDPVARKIRASGGQPSLRILGQELPRSLLVADNVPDGSESQPSQKKPGTARPAIFDGAELAATTAILPPWLHRYHDTIPTATGATRCGFNSLPVDAARCRPKFTELSAQTLCDALELRCPGHGDIVPGISATVLSIRSGMTRKKKAASLSSTSTATWLLFLGRDSGGKTAIARELANLVFGSYADFTMVSAPDVPTPSSKQAPKRQRSLEDEGDDNGNGSCVVGEMFFEAILENPRRVILIDDVDRMDRDSEMRIKKGITEGAVVGWNGNMVRLKDAIVVLSSKSMVSSPWVKRRLISRQFCKDGEAVGKENKSCPSLSLDLNIRPEDGEDIEEVKSAGDVGIMNMVDGVFFIN